MSKAKFHSFRGEKSALILVKANPFVFTSEPVYVPKESIPSDIKEGDTFEIPDGYTLQPFIDFDSGDVRTTKDGIPLKVLAY